jgi:hypothetical protein
MLKIDKGKLICAMTRPAGGPHDTGFINRHTGEVIFVHKDEMAGVDWYGGTFKEHLADHRSWEQAHDEWVEIPRQDDVNDADIDSFLKQHGLV